LQKGCCKNKKKGSISNISKNNGMNFNKFLPKCLLSHTQKKSTIEKRINEHLKYIPLINEKFELLFQKQNEY